jgi:hypothetical protein
LGEQLRRHRLYWNLNTVFGCFGSKLTLSLITMTATFAVLLHGVLNSDFAVHEELSMHAGNRGISGFEGSIRDEAITLGQIGAVTSDLLNVS